MLIINMACRTIGYQYSTGKGSINLAVPLKLESLIEQVLLFQMRYMGSCFDRSGGHETV